MNTTTFNVIGNHDHDQTTILSDSLGTVYFEMYLGPTCYSANIGNMHYVFVDNILYGREDASKSYELGLSDEIAHWLRQDLSYVPKDKTIMICAHSQMFKKHSSFSTRNRNYAVYRDELLKFRNVYSWAGHNHHTYIYNYNRSEQMPIENLTAVTVTRSTGSLRLNKHLNNDGTPQGYMIVDVDGDDVSWYYTPAARTAVIRASLFARADRKRLRAGQRLDVGRCLGTRRMVGERRESGRDGALRGVRPRLCGPVRHGDQ